MDSHFQNVKDWINSGYLLEPITTRKKLIAANELLDEVNEYVKSNPDEPVEPAAVDELHGEILYAGERHWTFQWQIILGAIISVILLNWWGGSKKEDIAEQVAVVENIKAWQPSDTIIPLAKFQGIEIGYDDYQHRYESAAKFKAYELTSVARKYYSYPKAIAEYERESQYGSPESREKAAKRAKETKAEWPDAEKKLKKKYDEISSRSFEETKKIALKESETKLSNLNGDGKNIKFWFWFLVICIPLYIFACRPYGYTVTRYATEAKTLNLIHRIGLWVSGGLAAGAAALQFTTIITKWSNGTTSESDDGTGPAIAAAKIALLVAALIVFCFTCCFIMAYATITGLIRNYDWPAIFRKAQSRVQKHG